jgi:hypothetical protein
MSAARHGNRRDREWKQEQEPGPFRGSGALVTIALVSMGTERPAARDGGTQSRPHQQVTKEVVRLCPTTS